MRTILALGLLISLCVSANAATVRHAHQRHNSSFAYAPAGSPMQDRAVPYNGPAEPYFGASQGYAPGEEQRFLDSVRRGG
jgi:hypothetical protein